jgi:hypothetical protein
MRPDERLTSQDSEPQRPNVSFDLFYYEQVGPRYYLRFTWLAVILIVGLTVISLVMIFGLFLFNRSGQKATEVNTHITPTSSNVQYPSIQPVSRSTPQQVRSNRNR